MPQSVASQTVDERRKPAWFIYFPVTVKFVVAQIGAILWVLFSFWIALPWIHNLDTVIGPILTILIIGGVAIIPGYISGFMLFSTLLDRRPRIVSIDTYPPISILVAAYNEELVISDTIHSVLLQSYPGMHEIIVIDDGSKDATAEKVKAFTDSRVRLIRQPVNGGKASALNAGLQHAKFDIVITLDADTYLYRDALQKIVGRYLSDPSNTAAVAGALAVRNSRTNWITRLQEWDYFHGIAIVKRVQSLYQGTLVAQGAFSLYEKKVLQELGGWAPVVGEDIVLSWGMLKKGYRIGYAENAVVFTNVPESYRQLFQQRRRWARGMFEAVRVHPGILLQPRLTLQFVFINMLFPFIDMSYILFFVPGVIAAFFGFFLIAGPITLLLIPLAALNNFVIYFVQLRMFQSRGLKVRRNIRGMFLYVFFSQLLMSPASIAGYASEVLRLSKTWGTK
ncbi:glycosyltransferase [Acidithiobacillus sp. AMEEHan]|uniref:glycosyltransferase n=1 Tax=Acidithiobacillus sp. AMEEHan TaxID=2994951 RepID=UPI0027E44391|nr:glycosyltransferase [Acidithiobacillus sp. AMEEHan]